MTIEKQEKFLTVQSASKKISSWLTLGLTLALIAWGIWYLTRQVTLVEIGKALALAKLSYIVLAVLIILITMVAKAWRWQLLFYPREATPSLRAVFWALVIGQFVNTVVPFLRLGEVARVYSLYQQAGTGKARSLGTLVIEKTLDLAMLALTMVVLLPVVVIPDFITARALTLGVAALVAFFVLYLLAYQTPFIVRLLKRITARFAIPFKQQIIKIAISGLEGVAALRDPRLTATLFGSSMIIAILSILTPLVLFPALNLPFGLVEAILIHIATTIATVPATTPAKLGIFEFAVVFMLTRFGLENEAAALSYAIIFHLVIVLPQILLGGLAISHTGWRWQSAQLANNASWQQQTN